MELALKDINFWINTLGPLFAFENTSKRLDFGIIRHYVDKHNQIKHKISLYTGKTYNEYYNIRVYRDFIDNFKNFGKWEILKYFGTDEKLFQEALQFFASIKEIVDPFYIQFCNHELVGNYYNIYLKPQHYKKYEKIILYMRYEVCIFSNIFHVHEHHEINKKKSNSKIIN